MPIRRNESFLIFWLATHALCLFPGAGNLSLPSTKTSAMLLHSRLWKSCCCHHYALCRPTQPPKHIYYIDFIFYVICLCVGAPCDILGSWNSEIIGLRFDINESDHSAPHDLTIRLFDHSPPKRNTLMDKNWTCTGYTLHEKGGPFYISATMRKEEILATFTGKFLNGLLVETHEIGRFMGIDGRYQQIINCTKGYLRFLGVCFLSLRRATERKCFC